MSTNTTVLGLQRVDKGQEKGKKPLLSLIVEYGQVPIISNRGMNGDKVVVSILASPINPSDINSMEGTYPHHGGGNVYGGEGVGRVVESSSSKFKAGDLVVPALPGMGWWRRGMVCGDQDVIKIDSQVDITTAAMLFVNPPTAYRMLHDFVQLKKGDWIIQNGGNSAVGKIVIQLCKGLGVKSINVVRDRPEWKEVEQELQELGADMVVKAEALQNKDTLDLPQACLGLNCVSGQAVSDMVQYLAPGATLVTYGGMSKRPLTMSVSQLVFRDIRLTGYWVSAWYEKAKYVDKEEMIQTLVKMYQNKTLTSLPVQKFTLDQNKQAFEQATAPYKPTKVIFVNDNE